MAEGVRGGLRRFIKRLPWYRFGAGVIAGAAGLLVTFLMRAFGLGIFLPEIAVDFAVGRTPGAIESFFIHTLGEGAKFLALLTALAVFLILPGIYATFFRRIQRWLKNRWYVLAFYTASSAAIVLVVILPLLGGGFFGSNTFAGAGFASLSQLLGYWVYAAVLDYLLVEVAAEYPEGFSLSRRQFIVGTVFAVIATALAFYGLASLASNKGRLIFASIQDMFAKRETPVPEFYVVTKNVIDPTVDPGPWRLTIGGMVSNPASYTYADLQNLIDTNEYVTLECVSNEIGGNLISTALWEGVRLSTLLNAAGVDPAADWIVFTCADDYTAAIPMVKAMDPATIVAIHMGAARAPLTTAHGFPARMIVPGLYGMFHAKWLTKVEAVTGEVLGYWQQKGWTNGGAIHTTAIIATPADSSVVQSPVHIGGIAFAGNRRISAVDVSVDGGATWKPVTTLEPVPLSDLTWVLWTYDWTPTRSGSYNIVARAVDGSGAPQDKASAPPFPNGSSGYDSITLLVG
ncbi:MAG TPA: molybdopterin-dependent oxidoreductase [Thermoplasmata archaeon]|nr:molybdopterin-dependent oxidoreductase [Thermoplasmata archaeon]